MYFRSAIEVNELADDQKQKIIKTFYRRERRTISPIKFQHFLAREMGATDKYDPIEFYIFTEVFVYRAKYRYNPGTKMAKPHWDWP